MKNWMQEAQRNRFRLLWQTDQAVHRERSVTSEAPHDSPAHGLVGSEACAAGVLPPPNTVEEAASPEEGAELIVPSN